MAFEAHEIGRPEIPVRLDPLRHITQRAGREAVHALTSVAILANETGVAQHAEMLRDGWSSDVEPGRKLGNRGAAAPETIENRAPSGVGDGVKDIDTGARSGHDW